MNRKVLREAIETARRSTAYADYLWVRERVLDLLDTGRMEEDRPSGYWDEELAGFEYLLDASPLVVARLREHCYHLTGLRSYDYRGHHGHKSRPFAEKLASLQRIDQSGLLVPESPLLGGFGHRIQGELINVDTLKFYECSIALDLAGVLAPLRGAAGRGKVVLEIGAGWGGLAFALKTLCPEITYLIVDLPQAFLFSGTYLKTVFPGLPLHILTGAQRAQGRPAAPAGGFLLIPHFLFQEALVPPPDLAINTVSFQEMTTDQVRRCAGQLRERGCPALYSLNRDRSPHNDQLTSISSILAEFYRVEEIPVLEVPYTTLGPALPRSRAGSGKPAAREDYRHLLGRR